VFLGLLVAMATRVRHRQRTIIKPTLLLRENESIGSLRD
jgi:hypothetical protein